MGTVGGGTSWAGTMTPLVTRSSYTDLGDRRQLAMVKAASGEQAGQQGGGSPLLHSGQRRHRGHSLDDLAQLVEASWHKHTRLLQGLVLGHRSFRCLVGTGSRMAKLDLKTSTLAYRLPHEP